MPPQKPLSIAFLLTELPTFSKTFKKVAAPSVNFDWGYCFSKIRLHT